MLSIALRILALASSLYVDQCDAGVCELVSLAGDVTTVQASTLPACATEGVYLLDGACYTLTSTDTHPADDGKDITL